MGEPKLRLKADDGSENSGWEEKTLGERCGQLPIAIDPRQFDYLRAKGACATTMVCTGAFT